jgi:hypothetical protein
MRIVFRTSFVLMLALLIGGCAQLRQRGPAVGDEARAYVTVTNQSWSQMRIFVLAGGQRVRLGEVSGSQSARFEIPRHLVSGGRDLSFQADALAGGEATSFNIYVRPGDEIRLTIPPTVR